MGLEGETSMLSAREIPESRSLSIRYFSYLSIQFDIIIQYKLIFRNTYSARPLRSNLKSNLLYHLSKRGR
jgi:hypothetical protein